MWKRTMALGTLAAAMTNAMCTPIALDPLTVDPDAGSSGAAGGTSGLSVLAARAKDILGTEVFTPTELGCTWLGLVLTDVGGATDPDALVLMFSNQPQACAAPVLCQSESLGNCADGLVWQYVLTVPPELVRVGPIDLRDPRIIVYQGSFAHCSGGGSMPVGMPASGTLEILRNDASFITVDLVDGVRATSVGSEGGVRDPRRDAQGDVHHPALRHGPRAPAPRGRARDPGRRSARRPGLLADDRRDPGPDGALPLPRQRDPDVRGSALLARLQWRLPDDAEDPRGAPARGDARICRTRSSRRGSPACPPTTSRAPRRPWRSRRGR